MVIYTYALFVHFEKIFLSFEKCNAYKYMYLILIYGIVKYNIFTVMMS